MANDFKRFTSASLGTTSGGQQQQYILCLVQVLQQWNQSLLVSL